jgi:hypothetical protein
MRIDFCRHSTICHAPDLRTEAMVVRTSRVRRGLLIAIAGLGFLAGCGDTSGADTPRAAVDAYIQALNARDTEALQRLAPPRNDATDDIRHRLELNGGHGIQLDGADITSEVSPDLATARLRGRGNTGEYAETLTLTRIGDRWHIALGQGTRDPAPSRAGTQRGP